MMNKEECIFSGASKSFEMPNNIPLSAAFELGNSYSANLYLCKAPAAQFLLSVILVSLDLLDLCIGFFSQKPALACP